MRLRRGKQATAIAVAVLGGLLSTGTPAAVAAPSAPGSPAFTTSDRTDDAGLPAVWPRPQSIEAAGQSVPLTAEATLVADAHADPYAVDALRRVLRDAGVHTVHEALPGRGPVIRLGGGTARDALRTLRAPERGDLPGGGYRIAVGRVAGRDTVAVDGVGEDGLFHGVQTLRQLIRDGGVAGVTVRDWPGTAVRGMTEGFYGQPWTRQERLAQIGFMGRTKQNRYLYAAGDDPYRQARWRDPYPADRRADFRALAERARAEHVTLGWAVAPGQAMCMSSAGDVKALTKKLDSMWALGVRVFQLQFQDVSYSEWHCDSDAETFGSGPRAAARAQARVAGEVARHLADRYPGSQPLSVMPTEFYQDGSTDYRKALAEELDDRVQIAWTGVGVVPRTITGGELAGARAAFGHPLVTMDNYPVNDYAQDRIFLGPYTGRDPAVAMGSAALLANAMEQPSASRIPLFTAADFAWNPKGYRPQESWRAAIDDLAGGDARTREALRALAGNSATSVLGGDESAYLRPLLAAFWKSRAAHDVTARDDAARALREAFTVMREAPQRLKGLADGRLDGEVRPWTEQLSRYGRAGERAVDLLQAQSRGDGDAAWQASLALEPLRKAAKADGATVGKGVLGPFLDRVRREADAWTGADRDAGTVTRAPGSYTVRLNRSRPVEAVTAMTLPGGGTVAGATLEAHVPGEGWRRLGTLSETGWTQTAGKGLRTDAIRISWPTGGPSMPPVVAGPVAPMAPGSNTAGNTSVPAPRVHALVPWFGDEPAARLDLARGETDAEIGGGPQRVDARLAARRPTEVRGALTAKAPKGIKVDIPKQTRVPRGSRTEVPVEITVPAGTPAGEYEVPLSFGDERSTLTVRAFPRTAGPDLLRTATASSSGDETPDFPASAAADGDPETRWSSPVEDNAWWQAELPRTARIGRVVLNWQDAYAARYRLQVSSDGRSWRTAATVRDGRGGQESVRMDAKDARYLRVQGDARGSEFGYSLWSVEAYAVAGTE
ncbi:beta-N-acetylglucosaminidase domain-containing protein [Streptomyces sp. NBC_00264]|uniref:beta-N-acetylglucosaminidase domain-containing protein n=1 Tax=unclassified Streptomyces TaxID=2593676 RepID=UPI0022593914|nr:MULTISPECIES: beta-N-acetylglucosaminidase domain-containing protein [unclassified Streptomyces]MCX5160258.1 beta-N-acetylglucosaminidase domain-containing protein [Streptomyces sp. NBC_00305]MCX5218781.1 beta-N-acetylglucosaminidase domain-containing protein [Streptomyces sp. NBC_00264]